MSAVALSGAHGFLGWHVRVRRWADTGSVPRLVLLGAGYDEAGARALIDGSSHFVHAAGVNRGTDLEIVEGNLTAAERAVSALRSAANPPGTVTFASSTQVGNGSAYGDAKARASDVLGEACAEMNIRYRDVRLPNLFGEHGRPFYNSVVATFCELAATGQSLTVVKDAELDLLHAQRAASILLEAKAAPEIDHAADVHPRTVSQLKATIEDLAAVYRSGDIPVLASTFDVQLFNAYRSHTVRRQLPVRLVQRSDARGSLCETVRAHGGESQTFFSRTAPGVTRGQHAHLRKVERFVVVDGAADIEMRRLLTDEVLRFRVDGNEPVAVDMPTLWTHNITNTGNTTLLTQFWTNEIYDPTDPDTYPEEV